MDRRATPFVYLTAVVIWMVAMVWSFVMLWGPSLPMLAADLGLAFVWGAIAFADARGPLARRKPWKTVALYVVALATLLTATLCADLFIGCFISLRDCHA